MERKCALAGGAGIDVRAAKLYGCSMAGRPPHGSDPDDWWATTPVAAVDVPRHELDEDEDWLAAASEDEPRPRRGTGRPRPTVTRRTRVLAAVAAGALVLLVLGLLAAGVFSSSKPKAKPPTTLGTTTARTTTAATTPTTPQKPKVVGPTLTLNPGASGPQTKRLQRALKSLGDDPGPVDGSYGPLTAKGVEAFQRSAGLTPDGIFGPKTHAALQTALKRS